MYKDIYQCISYLSILYLWLFFKLSIDMKKEPQYNHMIKDITQLDIFIYA